MKIDIRDRIQRPATPEEQQRHARIRREIEEELPELEAWAKQAAASHPERIPVGTVFSAEESEVIRAIDEYAARHSLATRGAVVRDALAHLLGIEVAVR